MCAARRKGRTAVVGLNHVAGSSAVIGAAAIRRHEQMAGASRIRIVRWAA
jgi:hypothetical protein